MGIDTHIKFDGVDGESQHKDHKGEIELLKWKWGVQNESAVMGGGSGKGKATPNDFNFLHAYDKASPILAKKCAQGVHFPSVVLTARKSGEGQKDFLKVTLKEAYITTAAPSGGHGGEIEVPRRRLQQDAQRLTTETQRPGKDEQPDAGGDGRQRRCEHEQAEHHVQGSALTAARAAAASRSAFSFARGSYFCCTSCSFISATQASRSMLVTLAYCASLKSRPCQCRPWRGGCTLRKFESIWA